MSVLAENPVARRLRRVRGHAVTARPSRPVRMVALPPASACRVRRPRRANNLGVWERIQAAAVLLVAVIGGVVGFWGYVNAVTGSGPSAVSGEAEAIFARP